MGISNNTDSASPFALEERFLKNKLDKETDTSCEKIQKNAQKTLLFSAAI